MNLEKLNIWLALGANIGVLIGIYLVAIELNQTKIALQTEASTTRTQMAIQQSQLFRDNDIQNITLKLGSGQDLTLEDELRAQEWLYYLVRYFENVHYQYQQGALDEEIWHSALAGIRRLCSGAVFNRFFDWPDGPNAIAYRKSFVELVVSSCG